MNGHREDKNPLNIPDTALST
ncbi:hypothetical protein BCEN4_440062 [Burkholderia cenocepacia]|nr:hypothetical protein BCEN4_440062 [Burkholderia cenocepacia]